MTLARRCSIRHVRAVCVLFFLASLHAGLAQAQSVDLVVTLESDQPAYMSQDLEHFTVTVSNNGPDAATSVELVVDHPVADVPFETSATCQALPGANPNGPAVCPPGSGTAPSPAFVRTGTTFSVTIPSIPSQSAVRIEFDNFARCPESDRGVAGEPACFGLPVGNYTVAADVTSPQTDTNPVTNRATTNIFLYPPDVQYKMEITSAPTSAVPGEVIEYEFEITSFGLHPSDVLKLAAQIKGLAGDMTPLSSTNNPYGPMASTIPGTQLVAIDCVSMALGSYSPSEVFPAVPAPWQNCPTTGLIPLPIPTSTSNSPPIQGFPTSDFLANLPGTIDGPAGGGVMRFRATVKVGDPVCVTQPETGHRELEFSVNVAGLNGTDVVPPGVADNTDTAITEVAKTCVEADIEFTTSANPSNFALDGSGNGSWTHVTTVRNLSVLPTGGTATQVPVTFGHYSGAFTETQSAVTCTSNPANLCPSAGDLAAGVVYSSNSAFTWTGTIDALPPGAEVIFSQNLTETRTTCWSSTQAFIDLRGNAGPSPGLHDPDYHPSMPPPPGPFTPGINSYFGNNGMQTIATVTNLALCPGGGGAPIDIQIEKTGPYASAADAASNAPLIGQTAATALADNTQVFFKLEVTNRDSVNPVLLGEINDGTFFVPGLAQIPSGFTHTGPMLADWGISCTATPASETCHELATTGGPSNGYNSSLNLGYDPLQHGGATRVPLAPLAKLSYIVPFTTPTHLNRCHAPSRVSNQAIAKFVNFAGEDAQTAQSVVDYYIGHPPCSSGTLAIEKEILPPADATTIPATGLISYRLTLSNTSSTETLDIAHLFDTPFASGVDIEVDNIVCNTLSGGALCPSTPIVPGLKTPAVGTPTPLPNPYDIDHEWGAVGDNTFPPNSSIEVIVTFKLSNPTRHFGCMMNNAYFSGENDPTGWVPADDWTTVCPPKSPELSLQKKVSPQIAAPGSWVTYTLIVTNIGSADADGTVLLDPLPPMLLADNPSGYSNVTCADITGSGFIPNPQGTAVCPSVTSNVSGLSATIATFGANTALQFTYQALMPDVPVAPLSVDNNATVMAPSPSGLTFGAGTAQSRQSVQVADGVVAAAAAEPIRVPTMDRQGLLLLVLGMLLLGTWRMRCQPG